MTSAAETIGAETLKLRRFTRVQQSALEAFYNTFQPKGAALGLPPRSATAVHEWIESLCGYPNFLVYDAERIVGHALLCPEVYTGEVAIFVDEHYRGRGIGKRLLQVLIVEGMEMGLRRIWGIAEPDNVPMLRLANSCGFSPGKDLGEFCLDLTSTYNLLATSRTPRT